MTVETERLSISRWKKEPMEAEQDSTFNTSANLKFLISRALNINTTLNVFFVNGCLGADVGSCCVFFWLVIFFNN